MGDGREAIRKQSAATADMQDGFSPEAWDASDTSDTQFFAVETGPRRRIVIGEVMKGSEPHNLYGYAASQVGIGFNHTTGEYIHVDAGSVDADSGQRVHLDQYLPFSWGEITNTLDRAFTSNDPASATTRRPSVKAGKVYKTIGS